MKSKFRSYFLRGLAVLLPTILTIWIFVWGYAFIQENIGQHINYGLVFLIGFVQKTILHTEPTAREVLIKFWVKGAGSITGFLAALVVVWIVGAMLASVVGKSLWHVIERFILNTPFLKQVYPYVKQITDFLLVEDRKAKLFNRVVAIQYPRKGIWSIGLVTGSGLKKVVENQQKEFVTILVPTSPTPFTGFVIMVPVEDTLELDISIEEAVRFTVSGGVITPSTNLEEIKALEQKQ